MSKLSTGIRTQRLEEAEKRELTLSPNNNNFQSNKQPKGQTPRQEFYSSSGKIAQVRVTLEQEVVQVVVLKGPSLIPTQAFSSSSPISFHKIKIIAGGKTRPLVRVGCDFDEDEAQSLLHHSPSLITTSSNSPIPILLLLPVGLPSGDVIASVITELVAILITVLILLLRPLFLNYSSKAGLTTAAPIPPVIIVIVIILTGENSLLRGSVSVRRPQLTTPVPIVAAAGTGGNCELNCHSLDSCETITGTPDLSGSHYSYYSHPPSVNGRGGAGAGSLESGDQHHITSQICCHHTNPFLSFEIYANNGERNGSNVTVLIWS